MDQHIVETIVNQVMAALEAKKGMIRVEASGRHVHLSEADAIKLFGSADLTIDRSLSQTGQYLSKEKVTLIGPKGVIHAVAVLGPCRGKTQVELSMTDARIIGIKPVVRDSGDLEGASDIVLSVAGRVVEAKSAAIVARRHLHLSPKDAVDLDVKDRDIVSVTVFGQRQTTFDDVLVRVHDTYRLSLHLDYDEANAVGLVEESYGLMTDQKG
jgi:propanediol utilization protein